MLALSRDEIKCRITNLVQTMLDQDIKEIDVIKVKKLFERTYQRPLPYSNSYMGLIEDIIVEYPYQKVNLPYLYERQEIKRRLRPIITKRLETGKSLDLKTLQDQYQSLYLVPLEHINSYHGFIEDMMLDWKSYIPPGGRPQF